MANTYEAIATVTVTGATAANMEFTSIPATYTDLLILSSVRFDISGDNGFYFQFNNDTGNNYARLYLYGDGSSTSSLAATSQARVPIGIGARSTATASTFSNSSGYIPNYTGSNYKSVLVDAVNENNATAADAMFWASIWNSSSAITSIKLFPSSGNIVQYSTATLYGIKNS
jgi:hypothetical protein